MDTILKLFLLFFLFSPTYYSVYAQPRLTMLGQKLSPDGDGDRDGDRDRDRDRDTSTLPNFIPVKDIQISYYSQTLDHFNYQPESYTTFDQKYMIYSKHWGGAKSNSPILVYLGDEQAMEDYQINSLILPDYATQLKALVVIIEHRFYGKSIPYGMSMEEVLKNASVRGYFNSAQAIADYADLILHLKNTFKAHFSPLIVVGGSYGGMLAAWFRLKYPHIALGALASSAPLLYFDNIISPDHGYYNVVNQDFKEVSEGCFNTIKSSWTKIDEIGSKPNGLSFLTEKFRTCYPLNSTSELKDFLENLYDVVAQYKSPSLICGEIEKVSKETSDVLSRIYAGVSAYFGNKTCYDTNVWGQGETIAGYAWQTCSEMVMPAVHGTSKNSMFPPATFNLTSFIQGCKDKYNVLPRPHWITTYYGGHDMKLIMERFGSNIIFSNGLKDPYSSAGVLEDLSNSIIAVFTANGTHCMDIVSARKDDPEWLVHQRRRELGIIHGWIKQYYKDLQKYLRKLSQKKLSY